MTGLVIRDTSGRVLVDMTKSISQTQGYVDTNATLTGSVTLPSPPSGKTQYFIVVPLVDLQRDLGKRPGVTLSGSTLSWAYSFATDAGWGFFAANCRIYYGYY